RNLGLLHGGERRPADRAQRALERPDRRAALGTWLAVVGGVQRSCAGLQQTLRLWHPGGTLGSQLRLEPGHHLGLVPGRGAVSGERLAFSALLQPALRADVAGAAASARPVLSESAARRPVLVGLLG